jgi:pimeloyl-ACP methyl ester carboxylesterase
MAQVTVPGARLHVEQTGEGEPLLFVTGFAIGSEVFAPVLPVFSERFRCVTYDNRGAGRSSVPLLPTSIPELAADAVRVLDALGIASAHVHGVSMGGMVAQEIALRFPHRVRSLVLEGTSPGGPRSAPPPLRGAAALALQRAPVKPELRRKMATQALFSPDFAREHPTEVLGHLRRLGADRAGVRGALLHLWASAWHDTYARLPQVQAPTLVVHGELDALVPLANARVLAARIPRAELAVVEGCGHIPLLERTEQVRDLVLGFLDRVGPVTAGAPLRGVAAAAEPWTRAYGLQTGVLRTTRSAAEASARLLSGRRPWA